MALNNITDVSDMKLAEMVSTGEVTRKEAYDYLSEKYRDDDSVIVIRPREEGS